MQNDEPVKEETEKTNTVYTENPFSFNYVSLKKSQVKDLQVPSPTQTLVTPIYNTVGKAFGIDVKHDWDKYYDKVFLITEWAKERTQSEDINVILKYINDVSRQIHSLSNKRINDLFMHIRLGK